MSVIQELQQSQNTLAGKTCISCNVNPAFPMMVKHPWGTEKYVIPVCTDIRCRSQARMNWNGEIWNADEAGSRVTINGNFNTTGATQASEVYEDLNYFMDYND